MNEFANTVGRIDEDDFGQVGLFPINRDAEDVIGCFVRRGPRIGMDIPADLVTTDDDGNVVLDECAGLPVTQWDLDDEFNLRGLHARALALPNRQDGDVLSVDEGVSVLMDLGYSAQRARNLSEIAGGFVVRNTEPFTITL